MGFIRRKEAMKSEKEIIKEVMKDVGDIVANNIEKINKHPELAPHHKFAKEFAGSWLLIHLAKDLDDYAKKRIDG